MKKTTKCLLTIAAGTLSMYALNKFIEEQAIKKNLLQDSIGEYYDWKLGKVFYTKTGNGSPLLLVHDVAVTSSSYDWKKIIRKLSKNHTVYALDLIGCGRSDKPEVTYTNFMYVQLLSSFIKDVIQEKTDIVATGLAAPIAIMTQQMDSNALNRIILLNHVSIQSMKEIPTTCKKWIKGFMNLPLIGSFTYSMIMNPFTMKFMHKQNPTMNLPAEMLDVQLEAAHKQNGKGKHLYSSLIGNYVNFDIYHAVKKCKKPIIILSSQKNKKHLQTSNEYHKVNSNIRIQSLSSKSDCPQIEEPSKAANALLQILNS